MVRPVCSTPVYPAGGVIINCRESACHHLLKAIWVIFGYISVTRVVAEKG